MKRIKAVCITQTLCFSSHDGETTEYAKKAIVQECEKYKAQLEKSGTKYKILSEKTKEDGSIVIEIKKQYKHSDAQITMNVYNHIAEKFHVENEMSKMNLPEIVPAVV